jgi:oxidoreductase
MVGRRVVEQLLTDPSFSKVTVLTRKTLNISQSGNAKLNEVFVNYEAGLEESSVKGHDVLFMCLGTTRAQAGSAEAFFKIDHDYPLMAAKLHSGRDVCLLTSTGADANSFLLYPQTKGLLEKAFIDLKFKNLAIFQPGLLLLEGQDRKEPRFFEGLGIKIVNFFGITSGSAPISKVASAMISAAKSFSPNNEEATVKYFSNNDILNST